jgi:hypothetical protein
MGLREYSDRVLTPMLCRDIDAGKLDHAILSAEADSMRFGPRVDAAIARRLDAIKAHGRRKA